MLRDSRWPRIDELYHAALARDPSERDAFLHAACGGDAQLRSEVEALLAEDTSGEFLATPALEMEAGELARSSATMIGRDLGTYRIVSRLGAGGMGEVYRARDVKLGRDVAIKILPEAVAGNAARVARFGREARLLATLNHPHVATIHGVVDADGVTGLVLELVEGTTLADRIAGGPLPPADALAIAAQIADGLEAAHERGIVHRDLKPSNIALRPDGGVKILDFGLAKALTPGPSDDHPAPPRSSIATAVGVVTGTPAYMSPEQTQGRPVDQRTDIWAFGCVLYEMLTGRRAFTGDTTSQTLAAVMGREPDWQALPRDLPHNLGAFLRRCLAKDVTERIGDIRTMRLAMDGAFDADLATSAYEARPRASARRRVALAAGAVALVLASTLATWGVLRDRAAPRPVTRFSLAVPPNLNTDVGAIAHLLDVSPDGTHVVYAGSNALWLRPLDTLDATMLPGTQGVQPHTPFFSPDGRWIGFYAEASKSLQRVAVSGGNPVAVAPVERPFGATWHADDRILYGRGREGIWEVPVDGGMPTRVIAVAEGDEAHSPRVLPDGRVLFTLKRAGIASWNEAQIVAQARGSTTPAVLVSQGHDARYLATGHLVYASDVDLLAVPFDGAADGVVAAPMRVSRVRGAFAPFTSAAQYAVAANGTLVFMPPLPGPQQRARLFVWVARDGTEAPTGLPLRDSFGSVRISPDGTRMVRDGGPILISELTRPAWMPLIEGRNQWGSTWSSDGRHLVFSRDNKVMRARADGTQQEELFSNDGNQLLVPGAWSRNRRYVTFTYGTQIAQRIGLLDFERVGRETQPWKPLIDGASSADIAPGDDWIAYQSARSGELHVYVDRFPGVGNPKRVSTDAGGGQPAWSADGRELFYRRNDGAMMAVKITTAPALVIGDPVVLFEGNFGPVGGSRTWDVAPDGRFLMVKESTAPAGSSIVVVQNWFEELTRHAAAQ